MTTELSSRIRRSSAFTSRRNTGSISTPGSRWSRGRGPGRPRECARSIFIGPWWRRAGSTIPILPRGRPNSSKPCRCRSGRSCNARRKVAKMLKLQGLGRHTAAEQDKLAIADINALASLLGDKAFLMGEKPYGADATVFAFLASFLTPVFDTQIRAAAERHPNLAAYKDRITRLYFLH